MTDDKHGFLLNINVFCAKFLYAFANKALLIYGNHKNCLIL